jgi:hypothetical protein
VDVGGAHRRCCGAALAPGAWSSCEADGRAEGALLPDFLWHGAKAHGFRGDVWSCACVAQVLQWECAVACSARQVARLRKPIGWTCKVPITRAIQRDEQAIDAWRSQVWPALKECDLAQARKVVLLDESGFYLLPGKVQTSWPRGQTPILRQWQSRDHLSMMGAVTPHGHVYRLVREHAMNK